LPFFGFVERRDPVLRAACCVLLRVSYDHISTPDADAISHIAGGTRHCFTHIGPI
jgi:hypothetical protein